jgi:arginine N-succinyltransferase
LIREKIESSMRSFKSPSTDLSRNYYIFVLENFETNEILGVSMIHAQHGTDVEPHFYLTVGQEAKFSQTINTGFVHGTLKLGLDYNGPTEIGGLILDPEYRGHKDKLGKQLSFVRFLFMAIHPERFKPMIHSELMPPFDKHGNSPLWEAVGRRFMNMNYQEADVLSRNNKEFILSLFPSENIYQTLLPMEAREAIGKVGKETEPVRKMLESIGFKYTYEVDPFDGGPHYRCPLKDIKPIKEKLSGELVAGKSFEKEKAGHQWLHH